MYMSYINCIIFLREIFNTEIRGGKGKGKGKEKQPLPVEQTGEASSHSVDDRVKGKKGKRGAASSASPKTNKKKKKVIQQEDSEDEGNEDDEGPWEDSDESQRDAAVPIEAENDEPENDDPANEDHANDDPENDEPGNISPSQTGRHHPRNEDAAIERAILSAYTTGK